MKNQSKHLSTRQNSGKERGGNGSYPCYPCMSPSVKHTRINRKIIIQRKKLQNEYFQQSCSRVIFKLNRDATLSYQEIFYKKCILSLKSKLGLHFKTIELQSWQM